MCGICGFWTKDLHSQTRKRILHGMSLLISHRGPDDYGYYEKGEISLAHRRLSIIDKAGGHQPMTDFDANITIVYNGEVYNFSDLRREFAAGGYQFKTHSDTEVILAGYSLFGEDVFKKMNGMFALAIWDERNGRLVLARDRFGIKPLYYSIQEGSIFFASEIKAIQFAASLREVNEDSFMLFMAYGYIPLNRTLIRGIICVEPGSIVTFEDGRKKEKRFWYQRYCKREVRDEQEYLAELETKLALSVKRRMISDVPIGAFLSGGVDSSLVVALMANYSSSRIKTFSIGFKEKGGNEFRYSRLVAKKFRTDHTEIEYTEAEFLGLLSDAIWYQDEPLRHYASVPLLFLAREAKNRATVILAGEGADELFLGYPKYQRIAQLSTFMGHVPFLHRRFLVNRYLQAMPQGTFEEVVAGEMMRGRPEGMIVDFQQSKAPTWAEKIADVDCRNYLISLLMKQDRMTMAAGIESRVPFLDHELAEWAVDLPLSMKLKRGVGKFLLKKMAANYFSPQFLHRPKMGFPVPIDRWMSAGELQILMKEVFSSVAFRQRGYFDARKVIKKLEYFPRLKEKQYFHTRSHQLTLLWRILNFEIWARLFLDFDLSMAVASKENGDILSPPISVI